MVALFVLRHMFQVLKFTLSFYAPVLLHKNIIITIKNNYMPKLSHITKGL